MHKIADYPMVKPPRWIANRFPLGEPNNIEELVELSTQISGISIFYTMYTYGGSWNRGYPQIVHFKPF